jgi:prevent-host-death family protein
VADRVIPQRELRNNVGAVLRAAEGGETFTVTVRGRPVARVVPLEQPPGPRVDVDRETIRRLLAARPDWPALSEVRDVLEPEDDPWSS